jgi:hypothetical protein
VKTTLFRISRLDTGRHVGSALLAVKAQYCALALVEVSTLVRRTAPGAVWREIRTELDAGLNPGPLPPGPIARLIADGDASPFVIQYVTMPELETGSPFATVRTLDEYLRAQTLTAA